MNEQFIKDVAAHREDLSQPVLRKKLRAIIYCRVSSDKQERDGDSLEFQEAKCRQYADLHDIEVITPLAEVKSGFIHYSHREKLTLARQMIRDGLADMIIVWDLRRFSRNFVHSAMIFEEIESHGGQIVSVSENIDNSLTGKLIRAILAWGAESEREKIVEYASRRWQTRLALGLPIGVGYAPYGWAWGDKDKTFYIIDPETAAVRLSIFVMFVELDMSLRAIAHKLTEDKILTPSDYRRQKQQEQAQKVSSEESPEESPEEEEQPAVWSLTTVYTFLQDTAVLGILTICKQKDTITPEGKKTYVPHEGYREIPGGIPAIVSSDLYERAQRKLASNQKEKSHRPKQVEEYLLAGHLFCAKCGYKMGPFTLTHAPFYYYRCRKRLNKFDRCPASSLMLRAEYANDIVWKEMCLLFQRLERLQTKIEQEVEEKLAVLLEDSTGQQQLLARQAEIEAAQKELRNHKKGSYMYGLIEQDITMKQEQLVRFREELGSTSDLVKVTALYRERVLSFFTFLNRMRGRYHEASFQEKRNALEVLGVKVIVAPPKEEKPSLATDTWPEWFTVEGAAQAVGLTTGSGLRRYIETGVIQVQQRAPHAPIRIHRDEVRRLAEERVPHLPMTKEQIAGRLKITYSPQFSTDYTGLQAHSRQL